MSLQSFQTAHILANTIRLHRQVFLGSVLLVEGESDRRLFSELCDAKACAIRECKGKAILLETLQILEEDNFSGLLAILDRDYADFVGETFTCTNLLLTPEHDVECMLLRSEALSRVLRELGSASKLTVIEGRFGPLRELLARNAAVIGCLRLVSLRESMALKFDGMRFSFVNADDLSVDIARLVRLVISRTDNCALNDADVIAMVNIELQKTHDPWQVSVGHDVVELLAMALRRLVGNKAISEVLPDSIERTLRLAFHPTDFTSTKLCVAVRQWEANNSPYRILA